MLPSDPTTIIEDRGLVLQVWTFPLKEVHLRPVLPNDSGLLAYRATIRADGADERYPILQIRTVKGILTRRCTWRPAGEAQRVMPQLA